MEFATTIDHSTLGCTVRAHTAVIQPCFHKGRLELEVEMPRHGDSPASNWLSQAQPGQRIIVAGPRSGWNILTDGDWYLVMADDTGIPAATQVLKALPDRPGAALFEVSDDSERWWLPGVPDELPHWLYRGPQIQPIGKELDKAVRSAKFPSAKV